MAASAAKYCEKGAVKQSAASAASPDSVKFQAVIKSAASAASRKPKSRKDSRGVQDGGSAGGRRPRGTPLELPSLDLGFLEAALAADLIMAWNFGKSREAALAADLFPDSRTT